MEITENQELIPFTQYYKGLEAKEKKAFIKMIKTYMSESNFLKCVRENKFRSTMQFVIEQKLERKFKW